MGLEILSFTIKDVSDKHNYLDSLGKAQIAIVTRDATIGQAEAKRDWSIRVAECEKAFKEIQNDADRAVANAQREKDLAQSGFSQEVNQKKAEANMAYDLGHSFHFIIFYYFLLNTAVMSNFLLISQGKAAARDS